MSEKLEFVIVGKDRFSKSFALLNKRMGTLKTAAKAGTVAVGALGVSLVALVKTTATAQDSVQKFSDQLGISTEFISKMDAAAGFAGIELRTMRKAIAGTQVAAGEAARGIITYSDIFDELGVSIRDAEGALKGTEQLLPELADAFAALGTNTERSALAAKLWGVRGMAMLQMFLDGRKSLKALTDEAERFGVVVTPQAAQQSAEFNDALLRAQSSFKGLGMTIANDIMPIFTLFANNLADFIADNREYVTDFAREWGEKALRAMLNFVIGTAKVVDQVKPIISDIGGALRSIWEMYQKLPDGIKAIGIVGAFLFPKAAIAALGIGFLEKSRKEMAASLEQQKKQGQVLGQLKASHNEKQGQVLGQLKASHNEKQVQVLGQLKASHNAVVVSQQGFVEGVEDTGNEMGSAEKKARKFADTIMGLFAMRDDADAPVIPRPDFVPGMDVEAVSANLAKLRAMHDSYYLNETQKLEKWYEEQRQLAKGSQKEMELLNEIYFAKESKLLFEAYQARKQIADQAREAERQAREQVEQAGLQVTLVLMTEQERGIHQIKEQYDRLREAAELAYGAQSVQIDQLNTKQDEAIAKLKEVGDESESFGDRVKVSIESWSMKVADGFNEMLWTGKASFAELGLSFAKMITGMIAQELALKAVKGVAKAVGGGGFLAGLFHGGGIVGRTPVPAMAVPAGMFDNAPRLHHGLRPDEFPAILQRDEEVIPRNRVRDQPQAPPVIVNMNVNAMDAQSFNGYINQNRETIAAAIMGAQADNHPVRRSR